MKAAAKGKNGDKHGSKKTAPRSDQWACTECGWTNFNDRATCHNWNCPGYVAPIKGKAKGKGATKRGKAPEGKEKGTIEKEKEATE